MKIGIDRAKLAKSDQEFADLLTTDAEWIARTSHDVKQLYEAKHGPFAKLSEQNFHAFHTSLTFDDKGVISGSYKPLMSSLTLTDIFEVFEHFGMHRQYSITTYDLACIEGSCLPLEDGFCVRSGCHSVSVPPLDA